MCIKYPAVLPQVGTRLFPMMAVLVITFGRNVFVSVKVHGNGQVRLSVSCAKDFLNKAHDINTGECVIYTLNGAVHFK
jgi:hypothetical protein